MPGPERDLDLLNAAVREAGTIALRFFGGHYKRWTKDGGSPVTEADLAVDTFLKNTLRDVVSAGTGGKAKSEIVSIGGKTGTAQVAEMKGAYLKSEQLAYAIREHVRVMTDTLEGSSLAFEVSALTPSHQADVIAARDRYERALRDIVRRGVAANEFRAVDPKLAVFAILGAINWVARWYSPTGSGHPRTLGAHFADHLVRGLLAP